MLINKRIRKQPNLITIWRLNEEGEPDAYGNLPYLPPVQAYVRYEERVTRFINSDGQEDKGRGVIYTDGVDIMKVDDYVLYGNSEALAPTRDSFIVKDKSRISNISGNRVQYKWIV
jgi:hypothetical protein